jgi:hypothetical protein
MSGAVGRPPAAPQRKLRVSGRRRGMRTNECLITRASLVSFTDMHESYRTRFLVADTDLVRKSPLSRPPLAATRAHSLPAGD